MEYLHSPYLFFALLYIIIFSYKCVFWLYVIQLKEYRVDRFKEYAGTPQGKSAIFNFWFILEVLVLIFCLIILFFPLLERVIGNIFFFFLVLELIFIMGKIVRKNYKLPKITPRLGVSTLGVVLYLGISTHYILHPPINIVSYIVILGSFFLAPVIIFGSILLTLPIVSKQKNKKIQAASQLSKSVTSPIKIGITGSYGKSSVKEYLTQILSGSYNVLSTPDNINSELGVSDVVLNKLRNNFDYFVAEMGAYKRGEISVLGSIVDHKYGFLTAIGNQHLALFGGIENTKLGKFEILESVIKNNGVLYVNYDNEHIRTYIHDEKIDEKYLLKYGINSSDCDVKGQYIGIKDGISSFNVFYKHEKFDFKTNLIGSHNILNLTGIIAFCLDMGMEAQILQRSLLEMNPPKSTLEIHKHDSNIYIDDTYNLSEDGLYAGLDVAQSFGDNKKTVLVLDDILELGKTSNEQHREIAQKISTNYKIDAIFPIGVNYKKHIIQGLQDGKYKGEIGKTNQGLNNYIGDTVFLFEGRGAKQYMNKLLKNA